MQTFEKAPGKPLFEQVREHLRRQCLNQPADVALPSLRQLSESLNVNHMLELLMTWAASDWPQAMEVLPSRAFADKQPA